jgi:hypothetical protein
MELDLTKAKLLFFDIEASGMDTNTVAFALRIFIRNVEYGFKGEIDHGKVKVVIPAMNTVLKQPIDAAQAYEARLDVYDTQFLVSPWRDSVNFVTPTAVSATLANPDIPKIVKPKVAIVTVNVEEPEDAEPEIREPIDNEEPTACGEIEEEPADIQVEPEVAPEAKVEKKPKKVEEKPKEKIKEKLKDTPVKMSKKGPKKEEAIVPVPKKNIKKFEQNKIKENTSLGEDIDNLYSELYSPSIRPKPKQVEEVVKESKKPKMPSEEELRKLAAKIKEEEKEVWIEGSLSTDQLIELMKNNQMNRSIR